MLPLDHGHLLLLDEIILNYCNLFDQILLEKKLPLHQVKVVVYVLFIREFVRFTYCCVPGCKVKGTGHRFPKYPELRKQWILGIKRVDP